MNRLSRRCLRLAASSTLALALLSNACRSPEPPPPFPLALTLELQQSDSEKSHRVQISLQAPGSEEGVSTFELQESWAGIRDSHRAVIEVQVFGEDGRRLESFRTGNRTWEAIHRPRERLLVRYSLRGQGFLESSPNDRFRVILNDDLFHMIGHIGLMQPQHLSSDRACDLSLRWEGFDSAGWKTSSSFGPGPDPLAARTTLGRLQHSLFVAGKLRIQTRSLQGNAVQTAIYGDDWGFRDSEFADLSLRIVELGRDFFDDHSQSYFLIVLLPLQTPGSMGGTALYQSFALWVDRNQSLSRNDWNSVQLKSLLAHELFHNWNGGKLLREEPEELVYWFSEGFTDFYARRLLQRAGLISSQQYARSLNELFARYFLSPVREASNERIAVEYWHDPDIKELPYRRGDVIAMLLDHEIRRRSQGRSGLDDLMREVVRLSQEEGKASSTESLLELFARYTSKGYAQRLRRTIVDGALPRIPRDLVWPDASIDMQPMGEWELGFDFTSSRRLREVQGVVPSSRAHRAGLRDGQVLEGWNLRLGDATQPVTLTVREGRRRRIIEYLPQTAATISVPRFSAR